MLSFISYWGTHQDILDEIYKECDENGDLKNIFAEIFAPIKLNTEKAIELKKTYEELTKARREREKNLKEQEKPVDPSPMDLTIKNVEKFENGEINSFK